VLGTVEQEEVAATRREMVPDTFLYRIFSFFSLRKKSTSRYIYPP
jgi:hypothetical protein